MSEHPDDARLRDALRTELPVPEHRTGFRAEMRRQIADLERPATAVRSFWRQPRRRLLSFATVITAAAAVAAFVLFGLPGAPTQTGPATASAAQVAAKMAVAMQSFTTLRGEISTGVGGDLTQHRLGRFTADSRGDFRIDYERDLPPEFTGGSAPVLRVFNASRHALIDTWRDPDGKVSGIIWDQCPPGAGFGDEAYAGTFPPGLAWMVRAALAEGDPDVVVKQVTFQGRSAWSARFPARTDLGFIGGMSVIVDRQTGLLLRCATPGDADRDPSLNSGSPPPSVTTLSDVRVDTDVSADAFAIRAPKNAQVTVSSGDYYCSLDQAAARVGYRAFLPRALPHGFVLADVATVANDFGPTAPSDAAEPTDPRTHEATFLRYRNGFDAFSIRIAPLTPEQRSEAESRFAYLKASGAYRTDVLHGGAFAGETAQTWFDLSGANLLALGDGYGVFISGSLTRSQLLRVASSLEKAQP
jgi:hypothetical protein